MTNDEIRRAIPLEEFDYQALMGALSGYAHPRDKVTTLLARGVIVRVKKGLYVFGEEWRRRPCSREVLANLLYGPSCVSLDYALHYHGLIPERVEALTSVTPKRPKAFVTPLGYFSYTSVPLAGFAIGMTRIALEDGRGFLIAAPEKALADKLRHERGAPLSTQKECQTFLVENLRVAEESLRDLDAGLLDELAGAYRSQRVALLAGIVRRLSRRRG